MKPRAFEPYFFTFSILTSTGHNYILAAYDGSLCLPCCTRSTSQMNSRDARVPQISATPPRGQCVGHHRKLAALHQHDLYFGCPRLFGRRYGLAIRMCLNLYTDPRGRDLDRNCQRRRFSLSHGSEPSLRSQLIARDDRHLPFLSIYGSGW